MLVTHLVKKKKKTWRSKCSRTGGVRKVGDPRTGGGGGTGRDNPGGGRDHSNLPGSDLLSSSPPNVNVSQNGDLFSSSGSVRNIEFDSETEHLRGLDMLTLRQWKLSPWIIWSLVHYQYLLKMSFQSIHNFSSYFCHEANRPTPAVTQPPLPVEVTMLDGWQTSPSSVITSAKEVMWLPAFICLWTE